MKVAELYRMKSFVFSIEIYPPKTELSLERLKIKLKEFRSYHPDFISVTYGAGGSTRENTHELASYIQNDLGIEAMAHLTCVSHTRLEIETLLEQLHKSGIENGWSCAETRPRERIIFNVLPEGLPMLLN